MPTLDLAGARHVVFLTGAGISAASGVITYRGPGGVYTDGRRKRETSLVGYLERPVEEVWGHYGRFRTFLAGTAPNAAHHQLAALEGRAGLRVSVVTQNVDGLHQRAGSREVVEIHGSVFRVRCQDAACGAPAFEDTTSPGAIPAPCARCGGRVRPDVVLFGELVPSAVKARARALVDSCDLFVAVGTSGSVSSARELLRRARAAGARCVNVNVETRDAVGWEFDQVILGRAEEVLEAALARA